MADSNNITHSTQVDIAYGSYSDISTQANTVGQIRFSTDTPSLWLDNVRIDANARLDSAVETINTTISELQDQVDEQLKNLAIKEPGFDKDIKLLSSNLYKTLTQSISGFKNPYPNQNTHNLDKTIKGMTNFGSISEALDEQTARLKNDLSGEPVIIAPDMTEITDIKFSKASTIKGKEKLAYKKTLSLENSKDKDFSKKEIISSSSRNKNSIKGMESSSKNILTEEPKE